MSSKRIIVITPRNISPKGTKPRVHMPLGALMVASQLEADGYDVMLFDTSIGKVDEDNIQDYFQSYSQEILYDDISYWRTGLSDEEILSKIILFGPDLLCISCTTVVDREDVKHLIHFIHERLPEIPIVLGGHEVTHNYRQILSDDSIERDKISGVTCIALGIGQPYITPICKFIFDGYKGELPLNSAWNVNGKVIASWDISKKYLNINSYALPNYNLLEKIFVKNRNKPYDVYSFLGNTHAGNIKYLCKENNHIVSYYPIFTSYGCGNNCTFCDTDKYLIRYNIHNVCSMIDSFHDIFGIDYIDFMDNNFAGGNKNSREICFAILNYIAKRGFNIGFSNGLTFESMIRNDFELLKVFSQNKNVLHISFPCENGNDRVLKMIRKPHSIDIINQTLNHAQMLLPSTNKEGFFIGGFPDTLNETAETPTEINNTVKYIEQLLDKRLLNQAIFLKLSPVTSIYRKMWNEKYPDKSFAHCLFSKGTAIWPYDNKILEEARVFVNFLNEKYNRTRTRKL